MNEVYHDTTEFTPLELQLDIKPKRFWEGWISLPPRNEMPYQEKIILVANRIKSKGQKRADKVNSSHNLRIYSKGDQVLVLACNVSEALYKVVGKFLSLYDGPYIICDVFNDCTYKLKYPNSNLIRGMFHSTALRPYYVTEAPTSQGQAKDHAPGNLVSTTN